jgi:hypothetical protein
MASCVFERLQWTSLVLPLAVSVVPDKRVGMMVHSVAARIVKFGLSVAKMAFKVDLYSLLLDLTRFGR